MKITKISAQVKNPDRVSIYIDGVYSLSLNLDQLLVEKLKVGLELDESRVEQLKKLSTIGKIRMRTIEWLYIRPRSEKELVTYLKKKQLSDEDTTVLIKDMQDKEYQNDLKFAIWWRDQRLLKNKSKRYIAQELRLKGLDTVTVNNVMLELDDKQSLADLIDKKRLLTKYPDRQKLALYLMRQGFDYPLIKEYLLGISQLP